MYKLKRLSALLMVTLLMLTVPFSQVTVRAEGTAPKLPAGFNSPYYVIEYAPAAGKYFLAGSEEAWQGTNGSAFVYGPCVLYSYTPAVDTGWVFVRTQNDCELEHNGDGWIIANNHDIPNLSAHSNGISLSRTEITAFYSHLYTNYGIGDGTDPNTDSPYSFPAFEDYAGYYAAVGEGFEQVSGQLSEIKEVNEGILQALREMRSTQAQAADYLSYILVSNAIIIGVMIFMLISYFLGGVHN